jgi:DNA-binding transcriptional regulator YiaG
MSVACSLRQPWNHDLLFFAMDMIDTTMTQRQPKQGVGNRIRLMREALQLNQTEYARVLKVTQGTVSDWENEKTFSGRGMLRLMADLFQNPNEVFKWLESGRDFPGLRPKIKY